MSHPTAPPRILRRLALAVVVLALFVGAGVTTGAVLPPAAAPSATTHPVTRAMLAADPKPLDRLEEIYFDRSDNNYGIATCADAYGERFILSRTADQSIAYGWRLEARRGGVRLWRKLLWSGPADTRPRILCSPQGELFVSVTSGLDIRIQRLDKDTGAVIWDTRWTGADNRIPLAMSADASGRNLYAATNSGAFGEVWRVDRETGGAQRIFFARDVMTGTEPEFRIFDVSATADDTIYIVGHVRGRLQDIDATESGGDYAVVRLDYSGKVKWAYAKYNCEAFTLDLAAPVAYQVDTDNSGDATVLVQQKAGIYQCADARSYWYLQRFRRKDGHRLYTQQMSRLGGGMGLETVNPDPATAKLAVDPWGYAYVVADDVVRLGDTSAEIAPYLSMVSPNGAVLLKKRIGTNGLTFEDVAIGDAGYVYVTGSTYGPLDDPPPGDGTDAKFGAYVAKFQGRDADTDGDGLLDRWETEGYTGELGGYVNLPMMGADPLHKDVFVQVDYMTGARVKWGETIRPRASGLAKVVKAFADADQVSNPDGTTGITLHIDAGPSSPRNAAGETWGALSQSSVIPYTGAWSFPADFDAWKKAGMPPERWPIFHYCVFAERTADGAAGMSKGISASDFFVGQGSTEIVESATFMHELGHNLGLWHGGTNDLNFKPNYLSIMNYAYELTGLTELAADGSPIPGVLDFSRFGAQEIATLDEASLSESEGFFNGSSFAPFWDLGGGLYRPKYSALLGPEPSVTVAVNAFWPVDFDNDGSIAAGYVRANLNGGRGGYANTSSADVLESFRDWENLIFSGGNIGKAAASLGEDVVPVPVQTDPPITPRPQFGVDVTQPDHLGLKPGASGSLAFVITNTGTDADTYTLSATSSAGWSDLSTLPLTVVLEPGATRTVTVPVGVPATAAVGDQDRIDFTVRSATHELLQDVSSPVVMAVRETTVTPVEVPIPTGGDADQLDAGKVWSLPRGYVMWQGNLYDPHTRAQTTFPVPTAHYLYPAVGQQTNRPYGNVDGGRVPLTTADSYTHPSQYYFGVADLTTGAEQYANIPAAHQVVASRLSGDYVAFIESEPLDAWPWDIQRLQLWNLRTDTIRTLQTTVGGADPKLDDFSGTRIVWANGQGDGLGEGPGVWSYDITTDQVTRLGPGGLSASVSGDHAAWLASDPLTGAGMVYVHDFTDGTTTRISDAVVPTSNGYLDLDGRRVVWTDGTVNRDIVCYDMVTRQTSVVAAAVPSVDDRGNIAAGPHVDGDVVLWSDLRTGILVAVLPSGSVAPTTTATLSPATPDADPWYSAPPQVTLTADQPNAIIRYQWDGTEATSWSTYRGPLPALEGDRTLYFYAEDALQNAETPRSVRIQTDTTPPSTTLDVPQDIMVPGTNEYSFAPTFALASNEPGTTYFQWDAVDAGGWTAYDGPLTALEGPHVCHFYSVDAVGNVERPKSQVFNVDAAPDQTPPTLTLAPSLAADPDGIYRVRPRVTATVDEVATVAFRWDSAGGIGEPVTQPLRASAPRGPGELPQFLANGEGWTTYTGPLWVPDGAHKLYAYATDSHGNHSEVVELDLDVQIPHTGRALAFDRVEDVAGTVGTALALTVHASGPEVEAAELTYDAAGVPDGAAFDAATRTFTWVPAATQTGIHSVTFTARALDASAELTVRITVSAPDRPNHAPVTADVAVVTAMDTAVAVTLAASDADADPLTWRQATAPAHGTVTGTAPTLTYQPAPGFTGADGFAFEVSDGKGGLATSHVTITVTAAPSRTALVHRLSGRDPARASLAASRWGFAERSARTVILASASSWSDALSATGLAACYHAPVLLSEASRLAPGTFAELRRLGARRVIVVGATAHVRQAVVTSLRRAGLKASRFDARDPYALAAKVARTMFTLRGRPGTMEAMLVRSDRPDDAISVSPVAYSRGVPVLLTPPTALSAASARALQDIGADTVVIAGDERAVSRAVEKGVAALPVKAVVTRWGGRTSVLTGMVVAEQATTRGWSAFAHVGIASTREPTSALSAATAIGRTNGVMLSTTGSRLSSPTAATLLRHKVDIADVAVCARDDAVRSEVLDQLRDILNQAR